MPVQRAAMEIGGEGETLVLTLSGRLDADGAASLWLVAVDRVEKRRPRRLQVDARNVDYCNGAGIALLVELCCRQHRNGGEYRLDHLRPEFRQLFDLYDPAALPSPPAATAEPSHLPEEVGRASWRLWVGIRELVSFIGELSIDLLEAFRHPRRLRWGDTFLTAEKAGVNALPIVLLVSFLVGLIIAFQAAIPMRTFGAEIYVANLIGIAMLRELGPLMTALVLAGRSGSAFAAEIGTMKVNEEIDALRTMGIDPVRYLVVSRIVGAVLMIPFLTVFADLVGVIGGSVVLLSLGYPLVTYVNQILAAVSWNDLWTGLFKSLFFGLIVASIGCLHGLRTRSGPSAVGDSATRAVVSANILIIVADGIFAVIFFYLGI